jgi:tetraacyldisaccharide 4'-kinase
MPEHARLRRWIACRWYGGAASPALRPLSALYGLVSRLRRTAYARGWCRSAHPGVPVIVIGNLTVGGTGKTPLVMWLAAALREAGQHPGVVLRGYGGQVRDARLVTSDDHAGQVGDEAVLIFQRAAVPVAVGAHRVAAAQLLARQGCTVVLSDDGLQHLALRRDLAIVVVDGERGFGNGALLPAGPLRESPAVLDAADLVVVQGADLHQVASGHAPLGMELVPAALRSLLTGREERLDSLRGATVHAVAGIGNPERFFDLLRRLGARPIEHAFGDHHPYVPGELEFGDAQRIVMTEKDAVRCQAFANERMWCVPVSAGLPDADATRLLQAVLEKIPGGGSGRA